MRATCYSRKIKALLLVLAVMLLCRLLLSADGNGSENSDAAPALVKQETESNDKAAAFQKLLQTLAAESASGGTASETGEKRGTMVNNAGTTAAAETAGSAAATETVKTADPAPETTITKTTGSATETKMTEAAAAENQTTLAVGPADKQTQKSTAELFAAYRLQRQMILEQREKALREVSQRTVADSELYMQVQNQLLQLTENAAKEQTAENLLRAESGQEVIVYYDHNLNAVTALVGAAGTDASQAALIKEILMTATGVAEQNIKLIV